MSTRGDFYLRTNRTIWDRPFGQHFTILHDASLDIFLKTFKNAYALCNDKGYPLENCFAMQHPGMLEANNDKEGGFYANIDLVDNRAVLGYKGYNEHHDIYFRGTVDDLLSVEEHLYDGSAHFTVWGRHASGTRIQADNTDTEKDEIILDFIWFNNYYELGIEESEIRAGLDKFFNSLDEQYSIQDKEYDNLYLAIRKKYKKDYVSPEAWAEIIANDEDGIFISS